MNLKNVTRLLAARFDNHQDSEVTAEEQDFVKHLQQLLQSGLVIEFEDLNLRIVGLPSTTTHLKMTTSLTTLGRNSTSLTAKLTVLLLKNSKQCPPPTIQAHLIFQELHRQLPTKPWSKSSTFADHPTREKWKTGSAH